MVAREAKEIKIDIIKIIKRDLLFWNGFDSNENQIRNWRKNCGEKFLCKEMNWWNETACLELQISFYLNSERDQRSSEIFCTFSQKVLWIGFLILLVGVQEVSFLLRHKLFTIIFVIFPVELISTFFGILLKIICAQILDMKCLWTSGDKKKEFQAAKIEVKVRDEWERSKQKVKPHFRHQN